MQDAMAFFFLWSERAFISGQGRGNKCELECQVDVRSASLARGAESSMLCGLHLRASEPEMDKKSRHRYLCKVDIFYFLYTHQYTRSIYACLYFTDKSSHACVMSKNSTMTAYIYIRIQSLDHIKLSRQLQFIQFYL